MLEIEVKGLFTPEEYERFLYFMKEKNYLCSKGSYYIEYIQEFMMSIEGERKDEILSICVQKYPQIIGFKEGL
jgi:hypothetical protein